MTQALDEISNPCEESISSLKEEPVMPPEMEIHPVDPARLQHGTWSHESEQTIGEGDIVGSYSADLIATAGKVRKPFEYKGSQWVCVGTQGRGGVSEARAYRLTLAAAFAKATTYREKVSIDDGEHARQDPNGFYHAISVQTGGQAMVLCGPPALFVADEAQRPAQQLDLF
jgi:hypothetical protein